MAWSFDIQRECTTNYDCLYQTYLIFEQCMNLLASGDGNALYDDTGATLFTQGVFGGGVAGNICNPDAWALFDSKDSAFQILLKRAAFNNYAMGVYVSAGRQYDLSAANATTAPVAADEDLVVSEGQSNLISAGTSYNNNPRIAHAIIGDADEDYSFFIMNVQRAYGFGGGSIGNGLDFNMSGFFVDRPEAVDDDDTDLRAVFMTFDGSNFGAASELFDARGYNRDDGTYGERACAFIDGTDFKMRQVGLASPTVATDFAVYTEDADSDWTGRPWGFDGAWWWAIPAYGRYGGFARMWGKSRLFKFTSGPSMYEGNRGAFAFSPDQTRIHLGNVSLPWDGGATPVLI